MPRFLQAVRSIAAGRAAETVVEEPPPTACSAVILLLKDAASSIEEYIPASFLGDKSQSELIFLGSILLAILLFVIVLPAYETLFCDCDDLDAREGLSASPRVRMTLSLGVHKVEVEGAPESAASSSFESSTRSSTRSGGSCGTMETIEEIDEEREFEEEEGNKN